MGRCLTPKRKQVNRSSDESPTYSTTEGSSDSGPGSAATASVGSSPGTHTISDDEGIFFDSRTSPSRTRVRTTEEPERRKLLFETTLALPLLPESAGELVAGQRVYWEAFFVVVPIFCGYAALFGFQHHIKSCFRIGDDSSSASHEFGFAVSFAYIFNLIFRLAHSIVFSCVAPRVRVFISMTAMMLAMLTIGIVVLTFQSYRMSWLVLSYSLSGVAVGSFEANILACLTAFGHPTKRAAITGIPVGIAAALVGGFFLVGPPFRLSVASIYVFVACFVACGMVVMAVRIPCAGVDGSNSRANSKDSLATNTSMVQVGLRKFVLDLRQCQSWLPQIWHYPFAFTVDMFCITCFSPGVALYIYDTPSVAITDSLVVQNDTFFAVFNTFGMLGGLLGRWCSYRVRARHPIVYVCFQVVGVAMLLTRCPMLAPLSTFLVMIGDGLIYGSMSRRIDMHVPAEFNLIAISYWLFVGDIGSVVGSNLISYVRDWVVGG